MSPHGKARAIFPALFDRLNVHFDHAIGRIKERTQALAWVGYHAQQIQLIGTVRHRKDRGSHGSVLLFRLVTPGMEEGCLRGGWPWQPRLLAAHRAQS